jgi:hypothetical protein
MVAVKFELPPLPRTEDGAMRRVGIEIEFGAAECAEVAALVQSLYGGIVRQHDKYRYAVEGTGLGTFRVELDMRLAHPPEKPPEAGTGAGDWLETSLGELGEAVAEAVGDVGRLWMPREIDTPPIPMDRLGELERLLEGLRRLDAKGTDASPVYAFALQFNPEAASLRPRYILQILKAYLLLSDWLRTQIQPSMTRRLLPFASPFPQDYAMRVLEPSYDPDLTGLVEDYLTENPTRNRELDLLPLLAHLDPDRVGSRLPNVKIKPRPTFHYRLPDSRLGDPGWTLATEWNRWVRVERLAADAPRLAEGAEAYLEHARSGALADWVAVVDRWLAD